FVAGLPHGYGKMVWSTGEMYTGQFVAGRRDDGEGDLSVVSFDPVSDGFASSNPSLSSYRLTAKRETSSDISSPDDPLRSR
ncbi:MAG: hypothetical protein P8077_08375, partial [Gammaproteobacteria bacterium]